MKKNLNDKNKSGNAILTPYKSLIKITANVIGHQLIKEGNFVQYEIKITTEFNSWSIKKRYNEFSALNQSLIKKIPEIYKLHPTKAKFKNSTDTINERIKSFGIYLNHLFTYYDIFQFDELIDFIDINIDILELALSKYKMLSTGTEDESIYESINNTIKRLYEKENEQKNIISQIYSYKEEIIDNYFYNFYAYFKEKDWEYDFKVNEEFLNILSDSNVNRTKAIKVYEEFLKKYNKEIFINKKYYKVIFLGIKDNNIQNKNDNGNEPETKSKLSNDKNFKLENGDIRVTRSATSKVANVRSPKRKIKTNENKDEFVGDKNNYENLSFDIYRLPGILYYIANYKNDIILSSCCLEFLVNLLSIEHNLNAEEFIDIFIQSITSEILLSCFTNIIVFNSCGEKSAQNALKIMFILIKYSNYRTLEEKMKQNEQLYKKYLIFQNNINNWIR